MARGNKNRGERDDLSIASIEELLTPPILPTPPLVLPSVPSYPLTEVEDGRSYHPDRGFRDPLVTSGTASSHKAVSGRSFQKIGFDNPEKVIRCARRYARREVLFAKRLHRRGRGGSRRRNYWSNVKC